MVIWDPMVFWSFSDDSKSILIILVVWGILGLILNPNPPDNIIRRSIVFLVDLQNVICVVYDGIVLLLGGFEFIRETQKIILWSEAQSQWPRNF